MKNNIDKNVKNFFKIIVAIQFNINGYLESKEDVCRWKTSLL